MTMNDISRIWKDPKKEKPTQGKEVILLLKNGERHAGHWLLNANKYVRDVKRWKIYKTNSYVDEDEVVAWMEM